MSFKDDSTRRTYPTDLEVYLKKDMPNHEVVSLLKSQRKSPDEIEDTIERLHESRRKVNKIVKKVMDKISHKLDMLDTPDRVRRGLQLGDRYNLNDVEKAALRRRLLDIAPEGHSHAYFDDTRYTDMAKFLGFEAGRSDLRVPGRHHLVTMLNQQLDIQPKDQDKVNELVSMFESTRQLYNDVKKQSYMYEDVGVSAVMGEYDPDKHNSSVFISPVIAALFIPKIKSLENRMVLTNIARMVLSRAGSDLKNRVNLYDSLMANELENELEFAHDIATDPNSLEYFNGSNDTPADNLLKRFRIQIELWKSIMNLRRGKYYASGYDDKDSGIVGLQKVINSYDWAYFDSPDMFNFQDEGTMLRKLLAVFSLRPTYVQMSSFGGRSNGFNDFSRTSLMQIPLINVRLPNNTLYQFNTEFTSVPLSRALNHYEWVLEHKVPVPKYRSTIHSDDVLFFYVNRHNASVTHPDMTTEYLRLQGLPASVFGRSRYNDTPVVAELNISLGANNFELKSVVLSSKLPFEKNILMESSAFIIKRTGINNTDYLMYNPQAAGLIHEVDKDVLVRGAAAGPNFTPMLAQQKGYAKTKPVSAVRASTLDPNKEISFDSETRTKGTLFIYAVPDKVTN